MTAPMRFARDPFGVHAAALALRARRANVLAANLANADTPGYKARDLDFAAALSNARDSRSAPDALRASHARHLPGGGGGDGGDLLFRVPNAPPLDGNTVDPQVERAAYLDNALGYQATLTFLDGRIRSLRSALKGE